jgi:hypothetical protein
VARLASLGTLAGTTEAAATMERSSVPKLAILTKITDFLIVQMSL